MNIEVDVIDGVDRPKEYAFFPPGIQNIHENQLCIKSQKKLKKNPKSSVNRLVKELVNGTYTTKY